MPTEYRYTPSLPYSEVNMHMRLAGKPMVLRAVMQEEWDCGYRSAAYHEDSCQRVQAIVAVQYLDPDTLQEVSFPVTVNEAGWRDAQHLEPDFHTWWQQ